MAQDSGLFTMAEFHGRGVIKLAPDALVYICGDIGARVLAPVAGRDQTISFNDGITNISIQNNIEPPGSSNATINISTPLYNDTSNYWVKLQDERGRTIRIPFFTPMMEVKIYLRGRFLVRGQPRYYPAFWGFITGIEEAYNGGTYSIGLQCSDMLHWWGYSQVNVRPIPATSLATNFSQDITAYATIFREANPYTILYRLTQDMGMQDFVTPTVLAQLSPQNQIYPAELFNKTVRGIIQYWRERFNNLGSLLKFYGVTGKGHTRFDKNKRIVVIEPTNQRYEEKDPKDKSKVIATRLYRGFNVDENYLNNFSVFHEFDKMGELSDASYMSKLEIATEIKNRIDFEFFQDVDGVWVFKPPFYNLNVKNLQPYVIKPSDILSSSFSIESDEIKTVLEVGTSFHSAMREQGYPQGIGFHIDRALVEQYGLRFARQDYNYVTNAKMANSLAMAHLACINAKCFIGNISIPGRPELRLGYPIYIEHRDSFAYVRSINHSFEYGGSFTTSLSVEAERKKAYDERMSVVKSSVFKFKKVKVVEDPKKKKNEITGEDVEPTPEEIKKHNLLVAQQRIVSTTQTDGRYEVISQASAASSLGLPVDSLSAVTETTVPYTDEEGYKVVGAFRHGRGIILENSTSMDLDVNPSVVSDSRVTEQRSANTITRMALSNAESEGMEGFFGNKATSVPEYLRFAELNKDLPQINTAERISTMEPSGSNRESTGISLVNQVK